MLACLFFCVTLSFLACLPVCLPACLLASCLFVKCFVRWRVRACACACVYVCACVLVQVCCVVCFVFFGVRLCVVCARVKLANSHLGCIFSVEYVQLLKVVEHCEACAAPPRARLSRRMHALQDRMWSI